MGRIYVHVFIKVVYEHVYEPHHLHCVLKKKICIHYFLFTKTGSVSSMIPSLGFLMTMNRTLSFDSFNLSYPTHDCPFHETAKPLMDTYAIMSLFWTGPFKTVSNQKFIWAPKPKIGSKRFKISLQQSTSRYGYSFSRNSIIERILF